MLTRTLLVLALSVIAVAAHAVEEDPERYEARSLADVPEEQVAQLDPLHRELRKILLAERSQLAALYAEFSEERDPVRSLEIQKQIQKIKQDTEISLMKAQVIQARRDGRQEDAERIEAGLRDLATADRSSR